MSSDSILLMIQQQLHQLQVEQMEIIQELEMVYMDRMNELILQKALITKQIHKMYNEQLTNIKNIMINHIMQQRLNKETINVLNNDHISSKAMGKKRKISDNDNNNNGSIGNKRKKLNNGSAIKYMERRNGICISIPRSILPSKYCSKNNKNHCKKRNTKKNRRISSSFTTYIMSRSEASKLCVADKIDHRDKAGKFAKAKIIEKNESNLKIHYLYHSKQYDVWCNYKDEIHRFAKYNTISCLKNHSFKHGQYIDINPIMISNDGWKCGKIREIDKKSGQILVMYETGESNTGFYWTHPDNLQEVAAFTLKTATHCDKCIRCGLIANGKCDSNEWFYCCKCWIDTVTIK